MKLHLFKLPSLAEMEFPEKTRKTAFRKCCVLKPENSSPNRDSNPHSIIGGRLVSRHGNITPCVAQCLETSAWTLCLIKKRNFEVLHGEGLGGFGLEGVGDSAGGCLIKLDCLQVTVENHNYVISVF